MRKSVLAVLLLFVLGAIAHGQTFAQRSDTFAFNGQLEITSWDGSDPANPPYPYEMGSVSLFTQFSGGSGSSISIPFQLDYLNGGYLGTCNPITFAPKAWTIGDGTHEGDTYVLTGSTTCPYYTGEYGDSGNSKNTFDGFSVVATYVRHNFHRVCIRFICHTAYTDTLQGGTGTATQTVIE